MNDNAEPVLNRRSDSSHANRNEDDSNQDDEAFQPLAPQYVRLEQRMGYVGTLILCGIVVAATSPLLFFALDRAWIAILVLAGWLALFALLIGAAHFWPPLSYRATRWRLNDAELEIRRGVFWKHRIAIPVSRVQHVDVSQGPVQRAFDLGKLTVHTAGTKNASIELDGLQHALALQLRDQLIAQKESLDVT